MEGDIDPKLLEQSGRASVVQDLVNQVETIMKSGTDMLAQSKALEASVNNALSEQLKRWRRAAIIIGMALFLILIMFGTQLWSSNENHRLLGRVNGIVSRIDHNQEGIDELVNFVHEVEAQQQNQNQSGAVQMLVDVLCASSDPVRVQACAALTQEGG